MLSVPEYQSVMRGSNYKEHLDSADSFVVAVTFIYANTGIKYVI
ncbi:hypothetical protein [Bacillus cereus group sp. BfR-BA-01382]